MNAPHRHRLRRGRTWLLALALTAAATAQAGIFRDVLEKVGISKPAEAPPAPGETPPVFPRQGFACCNLHYHGDTISDANWSEQPMLAAGTPITVFGYTKNHANIDVNGKAMLLVHEFGSPTESLNNWVSRVVINEDPRARIAAYPAAVQAAIKLGKVTLGMTREQAMVAVGPARARENASPDAPVLRMWRSRRGEYQLNFGEDGRLVSVTGDGAVTSQVVYLPPRH